MENGEAVDRGGSTFPNERPTHYKAVGKGWYKLQGCFFL